MDSATYYNEVVSNFDLNQLGNEPNVQVPQPNYEKLRRTAHWIKTKILTSDFVVQRYLAQIEDYNQALKAHSVTKEDLKQTCINYKNTSEKCITLENEVKASLAKQEMLQNKANDAENKYDALVSYTNQLQSLVKQLETEKEALIVEKKIDNTHEKLMLLQKEKITMMKDIMALAAVVCGREKKTRRHTNLIKQYAKVNNTYTSEEDETSDEMNLTEKPTRKCKNKLKKTKYLDDQDTIASLDKNFIDHDSDASNGRISVDTGRGSSRANSHKNDLNSPEYYSFENSQKISLKHETKLVDVANSPIKLQHSVSTSPIHFDNINDKESGSGYDLNTNESDLDNYEHDFENNEDNIVYSGISNNTCKLSQKSIFDEVSSPVPLSGIHKYVDVCTSPIYDNDIHFKEDSEPLHTATFMVLDKKKIKCFCQRSDFKEKPIVVDVCTSPILDITEGNKLNIDIIDDKNLPKEVQKSYCDKYTLTDFVTILENGKLVDVCTSPVLQQLETEQLKPNQSSILDLCGKKLETDITNVCASPILLQPETHQLKPIESSFVDNFDSTSAAETQEVCKSPVLQQPEPQQLESNHLSSLHNYDIRNPILQESETLDPNFVQSNSVNSSETSLETEMQNLSQHTLQFITLDHITVYTDNSMVECVDEETISGEIHQGKEQVIPQEKICLENNNSKNLGYEHRNDPEIQNIFSEMKITHGLVSPLSKSPNTTFNTSFMDGVVKVLSLLCGHATKSRNESEKNKPRRDIHQYPSIKERLSRKKTYEEMLHDMINSLKDLSETCPEEENIDPIVEVEDTEHNETVTITKRVNELEESTIHLSISSSVFDECEVSNTREECSYLDKSNINGSGNDLNVTKSPEIVVNESPKSNQIDEVVEKDMKNPGYLSNTHRRQSNDCGIISSFDNKTEISISDMPNVAETRSFDIPIKKKINKKSKLEKLRNALLPTSKIKRTGPCTVKNTSKVRNVTSNERTSSDLKNKIAYEKAVKIMTELKSKQAIGGKSKDKLGHEHEAAEVPSVNKLDIIKSTSIDNNIVSTRSQTLSKKEDDRTVRVPLEAASLGVNARDMGKSSTTLKGRKRSADTELNNLQVPKKRILRSSNDQSYLLNVEMEIVTDNGNTNITESKVQEINKSDLLLGQGDIDHCNINNNTKECSKSLIVEQNEHEQLDSTCTDHKDMTSPTKNWAEHFMSPEIDDSLELCGEQDEKDTSLDATNTSKEIENNQGELILNEVGAEPISADTVIQSVKVVELQNQSNQDLMIMEDADKHINGSNKDPRSKSPEKRAFNKNTRCPVVEVIPLKSEIINHYLKNIVNYSDVEIYKTDLNMDDKDPKTPIESQCLKENILFSAIDRYGVQSVKFVAKKIPEIVTTTICKTIENSITEIIAAPINDQKNEMIKLIDCIKVYKTKQILSGLMKYLNDPTRKCELFNKIINGPAPPMTKSEAILLYVIENLNITDSVYNNIEHSLFQLNKAPHFDVIESMSHFYSVMCTYFRNKSKLRCFMLDAMYCLQFKAVPLIKQCLDVCPKVLPMAHERMAKTSLVTCLVYLLHFYKCNDRYNRAQSIRDVLYVKYKYRFSEWNETMILEIFRKAIMNLRGMHNDKKMLRIALIILCKRHGAKWCETKIINNMLIPIIQQPDTPEKIKQFCVLMLGPLLKPFPPDKKAQCEIVINQLLQLLKQNPSHDMKEAIYSSLIFMNKHDKERVIQALLSWNPEKVSPDFNDILNSYVMEKPLGMWKKLVAQTSQCS